MQRGFARSQRSVPEFLRAAVARFLSRGTDGATLRLVVVAGLLVVYWVALALTHDFPRVLPGAWLSRLPFPLDTLLDFGTSFFAPRILVHLLPVLAALWLSIQVGAGYLADLFELESTTLAWRYLISSIFGLGYSTLEIASGDLRKLDQSNPLLRIGGPGYLTVHLGFAAVFESVDGRPRVYGATNKRFVSGFERLRDVVDLRDQTHQVESIQATTRDGIDVCARDAQMVFRVYSGGVPRSLQNPYPFTEDAVRRLVYGRAAASGSIPQWTDHLSTLVRDEICSFVGDLTIEEFLALQPRHLTEEEGEDESPPIEDREVIHIPRRELTERFHTEAVRQRLREHGLELAWVGVGTWEVPPPGSLEEAGAGETVIATWRDLQRARLYCQPGYLQRQRRLGLETHAGRLLRELIAVWQENEGDDQARCWALLARGFYKQLVEMQRSLAGDPESQLTIDFPAAIEHLRELAEPEIL